MLRFLRLFVATIVVLLINAAFASNPPNIVYILADDLGYGDVQVLNPERGKIPTPHLDRLAREGMIMTDVHSGSAVCTPTRYGVLTGRYAWRTRLQNGVLWGLSAPLIAPDRLTVGELLRDHGYDTAGFGKWHLGMDWAGGPTDAVDVDQVKVDYTRPIRNGPIARGFQSFFGISASLDMAPYVYIDNDRSVGAATVRQTSWFRAGPAAPDFQAVDVLPELTRRTVNYIEARAPAGNPKAKPFFIYVALPSPHTPIVPSRDWAGKTGLGDYADFTLQTDWVVGEVMAALRRAQIDENTLVIFTADNGCSAVPAKAAELEKNHGHFSSAQFRGFKADLWEGGHRVPFLVRWPARVRAGSVSDHIACLTDLLATAAEIVEAPVPGDAGEDSTSFLPTLLGRPQSPRPPVVHHSISGHFAIREGNLKLLLARGSGGWSSPTEAEAEKLQLPAVQLYDLATDPGERTNLAATRPEEVARLSLLLARIVSNGRSTPGPTQVNDVTVEIWKARTAGVPIPKPSR
ncbi:MAG TPA: arylsulfatase [Opitutaceae bacterium]|nr:arylsulfatase [Opitutaceae bacterium]